ncbi:MAG TPA: hypothetical protein VM261_23785 [Kofleriaceae bacterium]|nr:hypothetical protein [Kofleriaceae bacterium]
MAAADGAGGRRGGRRHCERCDETVHDFVGREEEATPGVCGRIGRVAAAVVAVAAAGGLVAAAGGLIAAVATTVGDAAASNVARDAGAAADGAVDAHAPLMGKLVFVASDDHD